MARKTYSSSLTVFAEDLKNPALRGSLISMGKYLGLKKIVLKVFSEGLVALPVKIKVELPPLGNYNDVDIQPIEPVLIVFDVARYPAVPPMILSDRFDFPKDSLAHLYVASEGKPPAFCLVRGDMADWYAKKKPKDLLIRVANWLRDAAIGDLTMDGGQFDPMRLEEYSGKLVYDYASLAEIVNKKQGLPSVPNLAMIIFKRTAASTYQIHKVVNVNNNVEIDKLLNEAFKKEDDGVKTTHYHIGYLIWAGDGKAYNNYQIEAPKNWVELKTYASKYGVNIDALSSYIANEDRSHFKGIIVIIAIQRPAELIGFNGSIEFSNHVIIVDGVNKSDGSLTDETGVLQYIHNQPLTLALARKISDVEFVPAGLNLAVGCGALGSKIIMHLGRSGIANFILVDKDRVSSHNLARHTLFAGHIGRNKAEALAEEIKKLYPSEAILMIGIPALPDPTLQDDFAKSIKWLFDFTASEGFFNTLINANNLTDTHICRVNISDHGRMGITLIEGCERNPRIDDLQISLIAGYKQFPWITEWLSSEADIAEQNNVLLNVGVGCNSETTIVADDAIALHAGFASMVIKREMESNEHKGELFITRLGTKNNLSIETNIISVDPFAFFNSVNGSGWQIRFMQSVIDTMKCQMGLKMPNETGGVFIGSVNHRNRTIHVVDVITEPSDSTSNDVCFVRGISHLPEQVLEVTKKTGGQLGYIGEWHTHPFGPNQLSQTDLRTVLSFKKDFEIQQIPLPVFLTVVTPDYILPYVF